MTMAVVDASFQYSPQNILILLLRVLSPALVLLSSLSLFFVSPYAPSSSSLVAHYIGGCQVCIFRLSYTLDLTN